MRRISNGMWLPPSTKVRLPRGSATFGNSMIRQSLNGIVVSPQIPLVELVDYAAGAELVLEPAQPVVQCAPLFFRADPEIEIPLSFKAALLDRRLEHEIECVDFMAALARCDVLRVGHHVRQKQQDARLDLSCDERGNGS